MSDKATGELPDSLLMIQVGAIRREEIESKHASMGCEPGSQEVRVVVLGIIQDDDEASPPPAMWQ
jgi:hypothetical protein